MGLFLFFSSLSLYFSFSFSDSFLVLSLFTFLSFLWPHKLQARSRPARRSRSCTRGWKAPSSEPSGADGRVTRFGGWSGKEKLPFGEEDLFFSSVDFQGNLSLLEYHYWKGPMRNGCGCQNRFGIPFWLVGEFTTHFRTYVRWGLGCSLGLREFGPWPNALP